MSENGNGKTLSVPGLTHPTLAQLKSRQPDNAALAAISPDQPFFVWEAGQEAIWVRVPVGTPAPSKRKQEKAARGESGGLDLVAKSGRYLRTGLNVGDKELKFLYNGGI